MNEFFIYLDIILGLICIKYFYDIKTYLNKINKDTEKKKLFFEKFKNNENDKQ